MPLKLTSPAFNEGGTIPKEYTCDGMDKSPELNWNGTPEGTRSFSLICDDPDAPAGTWVHWVIYGIISRSNNLSDGVPASESVMGGVLQGRNSFGNIGYGGPCPPRGKPHRYFFKLYALDTELSLKSGAGKEELLKAMKGHILEESQLMGKYGR
jgi:Raf kinase inhibitor-like YbhB/YbcL family protein